MDSKTRTSISHTYTRRTSHTMEEIYQYCTEATLALKKNNHYKYKRLLQKAKIMCPSQKLSELKTKIEAANTKIVEYLFSFAVRAMNSGRLEMAKNYVTYAKDFGLNITEAERFNVLEVTINELLDTHTKNKETLKEYTNTPKSKEMLARISDYSHKKSIDRDSGNKEDYVIKSTNSEINQNIENEQIRKVILKREKYKRQSSEFTFIDNDDNENYVVQSTDDKIKKDAEKSQISKANFKGEKNNIESSEFMFIDKDDGCIDMYLVNVNEDIFQENKRNARKLANSAKKAYKLGNIKKCERKLLKAKILDPSIEEDKDFKSYFLFSKLRERLCDLEYESKAIKKIRKNKAHVNIDETDNLNFDETEDISDESTIQLPELKTTTLVNPMTDDHAKVTLKSSTETTNYEMCLLHSYDNTETAKESEMTEPGNVDATELLNDKKRNKTDLTVDKNTDQIELLTVQEIYIKNIALENTDRLKLLISKGRDLIERQETAINKLLNGKETDKTNMTKHENIDTTELLTDEQTVQTEILTDEKTVQTEILTDEKTVQTEPLTDEKTVQTEHLTDEMTVQSTKLLTDEKTVRTEILTDEKIVQTEILTDENTAKTKPLTNIDIDNIELDKPAKTELSAAKHTDKTKFEYFLDKTNKDYEFVEPPKKKAKLALSCFQIAYNAFKARDLLFAERMLVEAQKINADFNWEPYMLNIRAEIEKATKFLDKNKINTEMAAQTFYKAKKAYDDGQFNKAELLLLLTKTHDSTLQLNSLLADVRAKIIETKCNDVESSKLTEKLEKSTNAEFNKDKNLDEGKLPIGQGEELFKGIVELINLCPVNEVVETTVNNCCVIANTDLESNSKHLKTDTTEKQTDNSIAGETVTEKVDLNKKKEIKDIFIPFFLVATAVTQGSLDYGREKGKDKGGDILKREEQDVANIEEQKQWINENEYLDTELEAEKTKLENAINNEIVDNVTTNEQIKITYEGPENKVAEEQDNLTIKEQIKIINEGKENSVSEEQLNEREYSRTDDTKEAENLDTDNSVSKDDEVNKEDQKDEDTLERKNEANTSERELVVLTKEGSIREWLMKFVK